MLGAAEELFVVFGIDVHVLTTGELGWPAERWRSWAVSTAVRTVLRRRSGAGQPDVPGGTLVPAGR